MRLITVILLCGYVRAAAEEGFSFAGLSLRTTIGAARKRYPRSSIVGQHVYVSAGDSHDHIYGIDLNPKGDPSGLMRLYFERSVNGRNDYPRCEQIAAVLENQYGRPGTVQEFDEERSRNRRLIWRRGDQELSLLCFRMGGQPLSASDLTIASRDSR